MRNGFCLRLIVKAGFILVLLAVAGAPLAGAQTFYTIDYAGAINTQALGINSQGEIVGRYTDSGNKVHGFILSKGEIQSFDYPDAIFTDAWAINQA